MTTPSPLTSGSVTTRTSMRPPSIVTARRPSCGMRFSAMSRLAMILIREITPADMRRAIVAACVSTPSIRNWTFMSPASGSKWMSDAPRSTAWPMIE